VTCINHTIPLYALSMPVHGEPRGTSVFWAQLTNRNAAASGYTKTITAYERTWKEVAVV
jgi:hypothetical protein